MKNKAWFQECIRPWATGTLCKEHWGGSQEKVNMYRENDVVLLRDGVDARIVSGDETFIAVGAIGTIVMVYGHTDRPSAYEVEFFIAELSKFALTTVDANQVRAMTGEDSRRGVS